MAVPAAAMATFSIVFGLLGAPGAELIDTWRPLGLHVDSRSGPEADVVRKTPPAGPAARTLSAPSSIAMPSPEREFAIVKATPSPTATQSPSPPAAPAARPEDNADSEGSAATSATVRIRALEDAVVRLTNAERVDAGCAPLRVDPRITRAARKHSRDMAERDYIAHVNPEGQTPSERMAAEGYRYGYAENIAWSYRDAESTVAGWMSSEGHRRNILDCENTTIGVGVYMSPDVALWTQDFGRE